MICLIPTIFKGPGDLPEDEEAIGGEGVDGGSGEGGVGAEDVNAGGQLAPIPVGVLGSHGMRRGKSPTIWHACTQVLPLWLGSLPWPPCFI